MKLETNEQYLDARMKCDANQNATREWCKANKTNGIPKEVYENFPFAKEVTNELRSAIEVYEFVNDPPANYFLYVDETTSNATTWMGEILGSIGFGHSWKSNMGDTRQSISVYGINGKKYSGIYYKGAGQYARIKMLKKQ